MNLLHCNQPFMYYSHSMSYLYRGSYFLRNPPPHLPSCSCFCSFFVHHVSHPHSELQRLAGLKGTICVCELLSQVPVLEYSLKYETAVQM